MIRFEIYYFIKARINEVEKCLCANTNPNFRYHSSSLIIEILMLLLVALEAIDFILETLNIVDRAFEDRSLVGLSYVKILDYVVQKLVILR